MYRAMMHVSSCRLRGTMFLRVGQGCWSRAGESIGKLVDESTNACVDLVADAPHCVDVLAGRIVELPVLVAFAGIDRAAVAAAHRDHDIGRANSLVGELLRRLVGQVDAELGHRLDDGRVERVGRLAASGTNADRAPGAELEQAGGHLASTRVVDADEQDIERSRCAHNPAILPSGSGLTLQETTGLDWGSPRCAGQG
jgi:hypothetical protein